MAEARTLRPLMEALGHSFRQSALLVQALAHPSSVQGGAGDNQRLEFLGDAVLQLCVSEALYARYPDRKEGELTWLRAQLVREASLARAAQDFGLGAYLALDHGEEASGGRDKPSVLADAMEAVLAAAYLDGGLEAARAICGRAFGDFSVPQTEPNWKSLLQEFEQAQGRGVPMYRVTGEEGPPHARIFRVEAVLEDGRAGRGEGTSKKQAEQQAAKALMEAANLETQTAGNSGV